jgi:hypothetical protein
MKLNTKSVNAERTHEGASASILTPEQQLSRSVMACMLWEDSFYENGVDVATRITELVKKVPPEFAAACAYHARTKMKLRHMPLLIVREMARIDTHKGLVARLLPDVIQRPDEITEFLSIYWKDKRQPLSAQVKKGLAAAFRRFDAYQFKKYDRDTQVKLRDALFLCHSKPTDAPGDKYTRAERKAGGERVLSSDEKMYQEIIARDLAQIDTWETRLSGGEKKETAFADLMASKKLGALAFLRNLRNMQEASMDKAVVKAYAESLKLDRVLPFRFIAAARAVPTWEDIIEPMMLKCLEGHEKLWGKTALLVDVSSSMNCSISSKSDLSRVDAAYALGILLREVCEDIDIFTFSDGLAGIAPRRGFALRDAMHNSQRHNGTFLGRAVEVANRKKFDRIIVITDEQTADSVASPHGLGYIINVAAYKNGVGYEKWTHINGWSEAVIDFIFELERQEQSEQKAA